eukprot:GHRR01020725.1.p1 GENE.GHRR01020725.1~~GHRR01020725.1.p1  ORF type:complete len:184 (+),score=80.96 GHRR01020725.1:487-1038(+)
MNELQQQCKEMDLQFDIIASACGSSGTTAGLALGNQLSGFSAAIRAYSVCDEPEYFYREIDGLLLDLGYTATGSRDLFSAHQAKGDGYALSRAEELQTVQDVALHTGVVLDPVYSGKAMHALLADMAAAPTEWEGKRVLFIHTGGLLGMYDKVDQLQPLIEQLGRTYRLDVTAKLEAAAGTKP